MNHMCPKSREFSSLEAEEREQKKSERFETCEAIDGSLLALRLKDQKKASEAKDSPQLTVNKMGPATT